MVSKRQLSPKDIEKKLKAISLWQLNKKQTELSKTYTFSSFITALAFVAKITVHAEVVGHHPNIELSYGKVRVILTTHDVKGLSSADFELAKRIDNLRVE